MLTVKLKGGMGNQMFQYAMGLAQARRLGAGLQLDTTWYDEHPWQLGDGRTLPNRQYGLDLWSGMDHPTVKNTVPTVLERIPAFDQTLADGIKDGDCLEGYWQDCRYFREIRHELRDIFFPKQPVSWRLMDLVKSILDAGPKSTSLCVRRGDFVGTPNEIPLGQYYPEACKKVAKATPDPHFFVFSDDPGWCKENFRIPYDFTIVEGKDLTPLSIWTGWLFPFAAEDIWAMSRCHNAVMANSTFSWWGAWLSPFHNDERTVTVPSRRFFDFNVPKGWARVGDAERADLRSLAAKWRSDKDPSILHGYTPYYQELLKDMDVRKMLEIGIGCPENMGHVEGYGIVPGLNLLMWEEYFQDAEIYGLDINPDILVNKGRIRSFQCDQGSEDSLRAATARTGGEFDLIIDDGSHLPEHQVLTAKVLIPLILKPGGIYIIEDVQDPGQVVPHLPYDCEIKEFDPKNAWDKLIVIRKQT